MSTVNKVSSASTLDTTDSYRVITEAAFYKEFRNAKNIGTDGKYYSEAKSITSFDIGDCITLFAIEKKDGQIKGIMGWHIGIHTTVEDIKGDDFLNAYVFGNISDFDESDSSESSEEISEAQEVSDRKYELYIVGGDSHTTKGTRCLLQNIHQAIEEFFFAGTFNIRQELIHLNAGTTNTFVSANLQMDGTLTICRHSNRHG